MSKEKGGKTKCCRVLDFYDGKSIFLTGAAGYLGAVLLEILLRCLPGITKIYILLRPKDGADPESRKNVIFKKWIFRKLLAENPEILKKVHVVSGDVAQPNFGMNDEDAAKIANDVSVVFLLAAIISFFKKIKPVALQNCLSAKYAIEFCRKMPKLESLVYTSTAYSNSNISSRFIEEKIYSLPFKAETFMHALEKGEEGEFETLVSQCKPDWPNNYAFSKCLAEHIFKEMASDLPVAIIRPSIIVSPWKGPLPGYMEESSGMVKFALSVGKGFARVMYCDPDTIYDMIPSDYVANIHAIAAWSITTKRHSSPLVVNCTGGHTWPVTFRDFCTTLYQMSHKDMVPKSFQLQSLTLVKNKHLCTIYKIYEHYIPAYIIDTWLYIKGGKFRIVPLYRFLDRVTDKLDFFIWNTFHFTADNYNSLSEQLDSSEKKIFYTDLKEVNLTKLVGYTPTASPGYDWKIDDKPMEQRKREVIRMSMMLNFFKRLILVLICCLIYIIFRSL